MGLALDKDIERDYIKAIELYEEEIREGIASLDSYINLAVLYWLFAIDDFSHGLPQDVVDKWNIIGYYRFPIIIGMGKKKFPMNAEILFWEKYLICVFNGESFPEETCTSYDDGESLVPCFFIQV